MFSSVLVLKLNALISHQRKLTTAGFNGMENSLELRGFALSFDTLLHQSLVILTDDVMNSISYINFN